MCAMPSGALVHDHQVAAGGPALAARAAAALRASRSSSESSSAVPSTSTSPSSPASTYCGAAVRPPPRSRCRPLPLGRPPLPPLLRPRPPRRRRRFFGAPSAGRRRRRRATRRRRRVADRRGRGRRSPISGGAAPAARGEAGVFARLLADVVVGQAAVGVCRGPVLADRSSTRVAVGGGRRRPSPAVGSRRRASRPRRRVRGARLLAAAPAARCRGAASSSAVPSRVRSRVGDPSALARAGADACRLRLGLGSGVDVVPAAPLGSRCDGSSVGDSVSRLVLETIQF